MTIIRSTLKPERSTCFSWSYMLCEKVQVVRYKRKPEGRLSLRWASKFMAWVRMGRLELRLHLDDWKPRHPTRGEAGEGER